MADKKGTWYAWSPILHDVTSEKEGSRPTGAAIGDSVTASGLGVSEDDFEAMVEAGSIRDRKPPELPKGYQGSMVDYLREQIAAMSEMTDMAGVATNLGGSYFGPDAEELMQDMADEGKKSKASEA